MEGSFVVSLFEILIYVIPGVIIFVSLVYYFRERKWDLGIIKEPSIKIILLTAISFFLGILNHNISSFAFTSGEVFLKKITNYSATYDRISNYFPQKNIVKQKIAMILNDSTKLNNFDIYRYSLTYVSENSKNEIVRINRLSYLQLFSRNSLIPVFLFFWVVFQTKIEQKGKSSYAKFVFLLFCTFILLFKSYRNYGNAKALAIYRTFLMIDSEKNNQEFKKNRLEEKDKFDLMKQNSN